MLITTAITNPTFANHESFHLRYGWLKKAYDQCMKDPSIFQRDDAIVLLGVGKNMVRAIKFWSLTSKILEVDKSKKGTVKPTTLGHAIFGEKGFDPYLEVSDTLWLLHWLIFSPSCRLPVWWMIMNDFAVTNLKVSDITDAVLTRISSISEWQTPIAKSIKKDIDVFIHTYTTRRDKQSMEDYLDCPFRQLQIVKQSSRDMMRFVYGKKFGLSPLVTAYACIDFISHTDTNVKRMSVNRLSTEAGGVGNAFKINEMDLADLLRDACDSLDSISLDDVNGAQYLTFTGSSDDIVIEILEKMYGKKYTIPKQYVVKVIQ